MEIHLGIIFFLFGLIIGSFLNVVIYRMNTARSFGGRSACMVCKNQLRFFELIPLFSFLGLRGRCRNCKTKISWQYPLVEFITGLIFAVLFYKFQDVFFSRDILIFSITYAYYIVLFAILLVIVVYDIKHKIIPDILALIFGILAFAGLFLFSNFVFFPHFPHLLDFLSGILIALPFYLLWLVSRGGWMGLGDAKLALGLGWLLGLSLGLSALVLSFWIGTIIGVGLILFKRGYGMKSEIPFAPYLALGTLLAFIFEFNLFHIYF